MRFRWPKEKTPGRQRRASGGEASPEWEAAQGPGAEHQTGTGWRKHSRMARGLLTASR